MTAQPIERTTEITCPPWCAGHQGNYQGWEELCNGKGFIREHGEVSAVMVGVVAVALNQTQDARRGFLPPKVEVFIDSIDGGRADLTASEARELAGVLLEAAERLETNR